MSRQRAKEQSGCPFLIRATEYVRGEIQGRDRVVFEKHVLGCSTCREEISKLSEVLTVLNTTRPTDCDVDVSGPVLDEIPEREWRRAGTRRRVVALGSLAALLVLGVVFWTQNENTPQEQGAVLVSTGEPDRSTVALLQARDWLVSVQESSGAWEPERWGGDSNYRLALTALAALALTGDTRAIARESSIRAGEFLIASQAENGHLGRPTRSSLYNHAIGTIALAELYHSHRSERILESTRRAARYLLESQTTGGAWGYAAGSGTIENESISVWALQALVRAESLGLPVNSRAIERGFEWFERSLGQGSRRTYLGRAGHVCGAGGSPLAAFAVLLRGRQATRTAHAAMDRLLRSSLHGEEADFCFYDSYFLVRTLSSLSRVPSLEKHRVEAQKLLADSQVRAGQFSGSWEPTDRWSPVGGRLYATALAALALKDPPVRSGSEEVENRSG